MSFLLLRETVNQITFVLMIQTMFSDACPLCSAFKSKAMLVSGTIRTIGVARGGSKGPCPPKIFRKYIVILCFEKRFSKQNSVIRLKSNILAPQSFPAGYATDSDYVRSDLLGYSARACSGKKTADLRTFLASFLCVIWRRVPCSSVDAYLTDEATSSKFHDRP